MIRFDSCLLDEWMILEVVMFDVAETGNHSPTSFFPSAFSNRQQSMSWEPGCSDTNLSISLGGLYEYIFLINGM